MKKIEQIFVAKISQAPISWMLCIVTILFTFSFVGMGIKTLTTTMSMALFGISLVIFSIICMTIVLSFYAKRGLANSKN